MNGDRKPAEVHGFPICELFDSLRSMGHTSERRAWRKLVVDVTFVVWVTPRRIHKKRLFVRTVPEVPTIKPLDYCVKEGDPHWIVFKVDYQEGGPRLLVRSPERWCAIEAKYAQIASKSK